MSDEEQEVNVENGENEENQENNGEESQEAQEPEQVKDNPLTKLKLEKGLSTVAKAADGLTFAFVKLDVQNMQLTDISILDGFKFLRYANVSHNNLSDVSVLGSMPELLSVKMDHNKLTSAHIPARPYLQELSASNNKIASAEGIAHPRLKSLNLSYNKLNDVLALSGKDLPALQTLELRSNLLTSAISVRVTSITTLYLANNQIESLEGLNSLVNLKRLHLRENKLKTLDGFVREHAHLEYLNLRQNLIEEVSEIEKLAVLPRLKELSLNGNPVASQASYRIEPLVCIRSLVRLDKNKYDEDEISEAKETYARREAEKRQKNSEKRTNEGQEETVPDDEE